MEDISPRAAAVGSFFQFVPCPKGGRLVICPDDAVSNAPAAGARIEILAGDALVTAEEAAPGLYIVDPGPAEGLPAEEAEAVELVATVVGAGREEVLLALMTGPGGHEGDGHEGHDHAGHDHSGQGHEAEPAAAPGPQRMALWNGVKPLVLPLTAGLVALLGAVAAVRTSGSRRWFGIVVSSVGLVTMIAATSLA